MLKTPTSSIETRQSWLVASAALVVLMMSFGSAWINVVALKDIATEVGGARSVPALASSLAWLCSGAGGILMGRLANRIGTRWTVLGGALMIALGLSISTLGPPWPLWIGHGLFIGLIGVGSINAPLYVYVSHWFDRRRGSALALISSGSYLAGAAFPPLFEQAISAVGWRATMLGYAAIELLITVPIALICFHAPPELPPPVAAGGKGVTRVLGLHPNLVFALMCAAAICCCIPMSMPQQHLVAFCSDLGFSRTFGAAMLSVLLGTAFVSRQIWGAIADRIGGLATILIGSLWQAAAIACFLLTLGEVGLITVSAAFGLGFAGIIPAYALAARDLFPAREAYWRIPTLLMFTALGMAMGGWVAALLYDYFGYYAPAFAFGVCANLVNAAIIGFLVSRARHGRRHAKTADLTLVAPA
jgi:MFS family permease